MDDIAYSVDMTLSKFGEIVRDREAWHAAFMEWQIFIHDLLAAQQQQSKVMLA